MTAPRPPRRLHSLDVLRGAAALSVVLWHWQHFFAPLNPLGAPFATERQPLFGLLSFFYRHGASAVQLFFCLSGFIFFWLYAEAVASRQMPFGRFAMLRLSRLYPLHFATLLLVAAGQGVYWRLAGHYFVYQANDAWHFVLNVLFVSAWGLETGYSFNAPIWSVSVEIFLYGVFFAFCRQWGRRPAALAGAVVLGWLVQKVNGPIGLGAIYFFLGALGHAAYERVVRGGDAWRLTAWLPAVTLGCWAGALLAADRANGAAALAFLGPDIFSVATAALFPLSVLSLALLETRRGTLGQRWSMIGELSYSSYLLHFPLQLAAAALAARLAVSPDIFYSPAVMLTFFATLIALSLASYRWFETPLRRRLRRLYVARGSRPGTIG